MELFWWEAFSQIIDCLSRSTSPSLFQANKTEAREGGTKCLGVLEDPQRLLFSSSDESDTVTRGVDAQQRKDTLSLGTENEVDVEESEKFCDEMLFDLGGWSLSSDMVGWLNTRWQN